MSGLASIEREHENVYEQQACSARPGRILRMVATKLDHERRKDLNPTRLAMEVQEKLMA